jgi:propionate catabolism operon transcriptional regulator
MIVSPARTYTPRVLIVGYRKFSELINSVMPEFEKEVDITIVESVASSTTDYASLVAQHRPDVIASAGSNASYLASTLALPVVSQPVTDADIFAALAKARKISRRVHLFTYRGAGEDGRRIVGSLAGLLDIELHHHNYSTSGEALEKLVLAQAEEQAEVVVGPSYTCHLAEQRGLPAILVYSAESARELIRAAISRAREAVERSYQNKLQRILLDDPHEPLVVCDPAGGVVHVNEQAEQCWDVNRRDGPGLRRHIALDFDAPQDFRERLVSIDGDNWFQRRTTIRINDEVFGYLFRYLPQLAYRPAAQQAEGQSDDTRFVIRAREMQEIARLARTYALTSGAVLIQGESGTGKEHIAREIHRAGHFAQGNLVAVNCGSIPNELFESEMFGYVDGAFTSSRRGGHVGLVQQAGDGVLFLDEVAELPLSQQAKLLRVLQDKRIRPVGGTQEVALKFKVIAATNRDLAQCVQQGDFREDLYYRLNVFTLRLPALRDRPDDIAAIAGYYIERFAAQYRTDIQLQSLLEAVLPRFEAYPWPGNVRELENFCERLVVYCLQHDNRPPEDARLRLVIPELFGNGGHMRVVGGSLKEKEQQAIAEAMARFDNDKSRVAEHLGISPTTLWRRLKAMEWS